MSVLITQDDVNVVRQLFKGFDSVTFESYVLEMQEFYLMPLLGVALYEDVLASPAAANNKTLLDGTVYEYGGQKFSMKGIKKYLSYLFFYKFAVEGGVKYTQSGIKDFEMEYSDRSPRGKDQSVIQSHKDKADSIGAEIQLYLSRNEDSFPLYEYESKLPLEDFEFNAVGKTHIPFKAL